MIAAFALALPFASERFAGDAAKAAEPAAAEQPATVDGFRSARFGIGEEQLRQAIQKDFPAAFGKLKSAAHPTEKTTVLALPVTDLLPNTGVARLSYILGYKSKKLIQVNITWTSERTEASDETVVGAANALREYFAAQQWPPDAVIANRNLADNAILVFRAADRQGRTVVIVLNGSAANAPKDDKAPRPPPLHLELSYIADPQHPDVFKIAKGQF